MAFQSNIPLKILNASAGSGKTYNLVKEYIILLISDEKDLTRFSRIIAMTFTNKAALEMKTRIIQTLDELSYPHIYGVKSIDYAVLLGTELEINPNDVHTRALGVLQNILHRYEDFFVMTIDKFNLKLIRSFSRDLDLPNDFEVILNESEVIEQVVDLLLDQLGKDNLPKLTTIVFEYAKNNLDEGERWNFRDQLIDFGRILSKERDQPTIEKLLKLDFSIERQKELRTTLHAENEQFVLACKAVYDLYISLNISIDSLPGKSKTSGPIEKLAGIKSFTETLFTEAFLKNCTKDPEKGKEVPQVLSSAIVDLNTYHKQKSTEIFVLKAFLQNFYNMAMLQYMAASLEIIKKDEQLIRISEFNKLISDLVRNEEAPFIYERLGTRFQHFLLDEFQDTSRLQWLNMVPLVHESISKLNKNLIVGDPKQSIYRFKNGVAEQFVALPRIFNPENDAVISEKSNYFSQMGNVTSLGENWRSSPTVVGFNNSFFPLLKELLPQDAKEFYNSIEQVAMSALPGLVEIISSEEKKSDLELVPYIISKIQECEEDGFQRGEICILGDKNKQANCWAVELTKAGYKIVSAESLLVQNEVKVKLVISYLKRRLNPSSKSEKKRFAELFFRIQKEKSFELYRTYFEKRISSSGKEFVFFNDDTFIVEQFKGKSSFFCKFENLYDLVQSFFRIMQWDELQNPYLHHFADFAHDYEISKGPDIKSFLNYYNEQKSKLAIQLPESDDAIKIMTIHKSKGLEFPVVILPSINLELDLMPTSKHLIEIDDFILYTTVKKDSAIPGIADFKTKETLQILTDKVNQCYVAFTRPMERLYVANYYVSNSFGKLAHSCFEKSVNAITNAENELVVKIGERYMHTKKSTKAAAPFFEPKSVTENLWFPDISLQDIPDLIVSDYLSKEQRFGNQFHLAMSLVNTENECTKIIQQLLKEGELELEFSKEIESKIEGIFRLAEFQELFEGAEEVLNEQSIIMDELTTKRPDKIILKQNETILLDYKTGIPKEKDARQMREYISTLIEMELPAVKGFLFYTHTNELIAV